MSKTKTPAALKARGSRASERLLLQQLREARRTLLNRGDLSHPVWVVVPTRVLRRHLQHRTVEQLGSTAGVTFWTLGGLVSHLSGADEDIAPVNAGAERDAERPVAAADAASDDDLLLEVIAARHLAEARQANFERGRGPSAAIRDLLDAGLEIEHLAPLIERLAEADASAEEIQRAEQLLTAAGKTLEALEQFQLLPGRRRFEQARRRLEAGIPAPERVLIYGFADLTGVGADFLQALVNRFAATVILNRPAEPDPATPIPSVDRYLERWESRLPPPVEVDDDAPSAKGTEVRFLRAAKPPQEMREVGMHIRALLADGVPPSAIGVVLRQPKVYGAIAARELRRLGVPCSAPGLPGELLPPGRRIHAVYDLLERAELTPLSRWLDARWELRGADPVSGVPVFAIRKRLARAGLRTLGQLAELELAEVTATPGDDGVRPERVEEAHRLLAIRRTWGAGDGPHHARNLTGLLAALGWPGDDPDSQWLERKVQGIQINLSLDEFLFWLKRSIEDTGRTQTDPWRLGGVRLLRIQDAREVTFEHLFVPGMSRGLFPRAIRGDSELREEFRERLVEGGMGLLPDLPLASRFHDEEKYLFVQLLSSASHVTLSWSERGLDERLLPPSPLLSLMGSGVIDAAQQPPRAEGESSERWSVLPPLARRIQAGLLGRELAGDKLPAALSAILREHDQPGPSPYLGWLGTAGDDSDRRRTGLWATHLESYARCPWQTFLAKFLNLEVRHDPDLAAPDLPPLAIGGIAHGLLAEVATASGVACGDWNEVIEGPGVRLSWPDEEELRQMVQAAVETHTREQGVYLPGYSQTLTGAVLAVLGRAQAADRDADGVLAVETTGRAAFDSHTVRFRVDRLERRGGRLLATDYKTGRARSGKVVTNVEKAEMLQLPTYVLGGAADARMLYLGDPDHPEGAELLLSGEDGETLGAFRDLTTILTRGWRGGRFFPRVLTHTGSRPRTCEWCEFTEACSERDPFARDRLKQTLDAGEDPDAAAVWNIGRKKR